MIAEKKIFSSSSPPPGEVIKIHLPPFKKGEWGEGGWGVGWGPNYAIPYLPVSYEDFMWDWLFHGNQAFENGHQHRTTVQQFLFLC